MSSASDFVIENGVLTKYTGEDTNVIIPEGVTSIGDSAFKFCSSLKSITIPEGVTSIGNSAFKDCSSLKNITIPEGVTSIGDDAFLWCTSLTSVVIPEGMTNIGDSAFEYCSSLKSITIPDSVTRIGDGAFSGCGKVLLHISDKAANRPENFQIKNSVFEKYKGPSGNVVIPEGVTSIGDSAFKYCSSLKSITIPEGVTSIGYCAFEDCSSLKSITIPVGVTSIGYGAFYDCSSLKSVTIPEGVTSIGAYAFCGCSSLKSVTIPEGVTSIGAYAFCGCSNLQSLTIQDPKCTLGKEPFGNSFPQGLRNQISSLYPHMTDGSLKQYILQEEQWESLTPAQQAEIFLSHQSKSLTPGYLNCVTENQLAPLSRAIMTRLDADKPSNRDCSAAVSFMTMFKDKVSAETLQAIHTKLLPLKTAEKALKSIESDLGLKEKLGQKLTVDSSLPPVEKLVMEKMIAEKQSSKDIETKLKSFYSLSFSSLPVVRSKDGENTEPYVLAWLLVAHETVAERRWGSQETTARYAEPGLCPEAAEVAAMLNAEDLQNAIRTLADTNLIVYQNTKKKFLSYPICRYADETTMEKLTKLAPSWRTSVSGNDAPPLLQFRSAVKYSDTRAAMLFAERYNELDKYAAVRGMTADEVRDQHLSDVGLDEQGGKVYDLGNQTVIARLQTDLSFLFELPNGKTAKGNMEDDRTKRNKLAREVLRLSRNQLLVNLRFLDAALSRLEWVETEAVPFSTDGRYLAYDPRFVLRGYKSNRAEPVRNYLHAVLHCIYRHNFVHTLNDTTLWDLACDIAVEHSINALGLRVTEAPRQQRQAQMLAKLQKDVGLLTAEKVYRYLLDQNPHPIRLAEMQELFRGDDHALWYMDEDEKAAMGIGSGSSGSGSGSGEEEGEDGSGARVTVYGSEADWKDISERMQIDMETFSKNQGRDPGAMLQNLREVNRERYDYGAFLRKFAVRGEAMKINDDEFDYIFYTYGLQQYGNMPLIEPLEYKEVKRIREFVIAIDTSGSVAGETVQRFVQKTYNILKSTESFFSKINLHIIQCDAAVQEDVKITNQEEFDAYLKMMRIRGLGGTDFRPVFAYVDKLIEQREFQNLKGLIYFTDGFGTFPAQKPAYESAFVFLQEEINNPDVPPWAIKLVLKKEEI